MGLFNLAKLHFFAFSTIFSCLKEKIPIFAPAISGEIDLARESTFFALFLSSESGQFPQDLGI